MTGFIDHPVKKVIREQWCKPLIKHIFEQLGYKLTYLGLPGLEAIDILTWIEYINKVIAFDIGDYSDNYNEDRAKINIQKLSNLLNKLEARGDLDTYSLYHGYIEEVVLKGMDRNRSSYNQADKVTIYNLDFCNTLTAPLKVVDPITGETNAYYKTEVIRRLLELQRQQSIKNNSTKFVFYITVHSKFWESEAENLFTGNDVSLYDKYYASLIDLEEQERNIRLLRYYMIDVLVTQFCSNQFIPEFLPTLYYNGSSRSWLLCFTVIGTFVKSAASKAPFNQKIEDLINEKFLQPNNNSIQNLLQESVREHNCNIDSVKAMQELKSYKERWV